jgi:hypothetical protein
LRSRSSYARRTSTVAACFSSSKGTAQIRRAELFHQTGNVSGVKHARVSKWSGWSRALSDERRQSQSRRAWTREWLLIVDALSVVEAEAHCHCREVDGPIALW